MRSVAFLFACISTLIACGGDDAKTGTEQAQVNALPDPADTPAGGNTTPKPGTGTTTTDPKNPGGPTEEPEDNVPPNIDPSPATHPEVVYVLGFGRGGSGFCTGTLYAGDRVLTAAHCLDTKYFNRWQVVAPHAPGKPRVDADSAEMFDTEFKDAGHPDIGIIRLSESIDLPEYAELFDVSARVDAKKKTMVAGVVRTTERPEAALKKTDALEVSSTIELGYAHGFGVPLYSNGGDSGAGLFLIEKGEMSHKVIGVEREPEPERDIDHLSRVHADFIAWAKQQ